MPPSAAPRVEKAEHLEQLGGHLAGLTLGLAPLAKLARSIVAAENSGQPIDFGECRGFRGGGPRGAGGGKAQLERRAEHILVVESVPRRFGRGHRRYERDQREQERS